MLRRIVVWDSTGAEVMLLTNHLTVDATTISAIYREQWQIAIFSADSTRGVVARGHWPLSCDV